MAAGLIGFLLAAAVLVLILRAVRQFRAFPVLPPAPAGDAQLPRVAAIVPARDEADVIDRCLAGLAAQDYPLHLLRITVVDDGSSDGTFARAARWAAAGRISVIDAGPLPPGWLGKSHACWRAAGAAADAQYLCFIDADTVPAPALIRTAVLEAARADLALLSLEPFQELATIAERLILPAGFFALAFTRTVATTADPARENAAVNGQLLLIASAAYWRIGGHSAVRGAFDEDSQLAVLVKSCGGRVAVMGGAALIRARMYRSFGALWQGLSKNSTEALGGPARVLAVALLGPPLAWSLVVAPPLLALGLHAHPSIADVAGLALALLAACAALALHVAGARYLGIPLWYGLLFPAGYTLAAALALDGLRKSREGRVAWKGRTYRTPAE